MLHPLDAAFPELSQRLPTPDQIRERLALVVREAKLLRQLLRLSEHAARAGDHKGAAPCR
jgi:hypothetical protein